MPDNGNPIRLDSQAVLKSIDFFTQVSSFLTGLIKDELLRDFWGLTLKVFLLCVSFGLNVHSDFSISVLFISAFISFSFFCAKKR